jgi:predicted component of type VI protein secretion system
MKRVLLSTASDAIELGPGQHVIGRDLGCQLRFNDSSVSRRHLRIDVGDDGIRAEDLGSRNGSYVNGRLLVAPYALKGGEEIRIGRRSFRVTVVEIADDAADERTATDPRGAEALRRFAGLIESERKRSSTLPPPPPAPTHVACPRCRAPVALAAESCPRLRPPPSRPACWA